MNTLRFSSIRRAALVLALLALSASAFTAFAGECKAEFYSRSDYVTWKSDRATEIYLTNNGGFYQTLQFEGGQDFLTNAWETIEDFEDAFQSNPFYTAEKSEDAKDWNDVISVRISLLMQSIEDSIVPEGQQYIFDGVTYGPAGAGSLPTDTRVRRVFINTISLRNRVLGV